MTARELQPIILAAVVDSGFDSARLTDTPNGLGIDSLDEVQIIMEVEEKIGREIPEDWLHEEYRAKTFNDLAGLLAKRLEE